MKMIGMSGRSASCCCSSRPVSPGSETSSTRQQGTVGRGRDRNSGAEANVSGCQPALLISSSSDSRTEISSSTMKTMAVTSATVTTSRLLAAIDGLTVYLPRTTCRDTRPASAFLRADRVIDGVEQRRIAEWFEKTSHRPARDETRTRRFVALRPDEHDWNGQPAALQLLLQIGAAHPR